MKLSLDRVTSKNTDLGDSAAEAIMSDGREGSNNIVRPKEFVPPDEWAKYALFNLALDWVVDQALARMKIENKWPFQQKDGLSKP